MLDLHSAREQNSQMQTEINLCMRKWYSDFYESCRVTKLILWCEFLVFIMSSLVHLYKPTLWYCLYSNLINLSANTNEFCLPFHSLLVFLFSPQQLENCICSLQFEQRRNKSAVFLKGTEAWNGILTFHLIQDIEYWFKWFWFWINFGRI